MKTIYTDRYGLYPWFFGVTGLSGFPYVYGYGVAGRYVMATVSLITSIGFIYLAIERVQAIMRARREGRDSSIIRIKDSGR